MVGEIAGDRVVIGAYCGASGTLGIDTGQNVAARLFQFQHDFGLAVELLHQGLLHREFAVDQLGRDFLANRQARIGDAHAFDCMIELQH